MTTKRESIFAALFTALSDAVTGVPGVAAKRNEVLPDRLDSGADPLLVQQDGGAPPGPLEVTLSPVTYAYLETVEIEVAVQAASGREASLDAIVASIGTVIAANRTLGGLADDVRVTSAPDIEDRAVSGAAQLKVATVRVDVMFTTTDPLS